MNNIENRRKTMQKHRITSKTTGNALEKNELCGAFSRASKKEDPGPVEPCMPGALHLWSRRASRHPPGILSGSQGLWVLVALAALISCASPAASKACPCLQHLHPPTPTIILFWPLCGWKTQFPTFCVCCTQGCRKEDPQT